MENKTGIFQRIGTGATFDPLLIRHLFQTIEDDFSTLVGRKFAYLKHLEEELGKPDAITRPDGKSLHDRYTRTKQELDTLVAMFDYLEYLTMAAVDGFHAVCMRIAEQETKAQPPEKFYVRNQWERRRAEYGAEKSAQATATVHTETNAAA